MPLAELAILACAILLWAALSRPLATAPLTPTLVFVFVGLVVGPAGLAVAGFTLQDTTVHLLVELTLMLVLFTDAARIRLDVLSHEASLASRLLLLGLPLTVVTGTVLARWLFPGWSWAECALLGAILAPTDPALAQAVVLRTDVPGRVRDALNVESGLNDGLCLPLVVVFASLAGAMSGRLEPATSWALFAAAQLLLGPAAGLVIGFAGARTVERAVEANHVTGDFRRLSTVGLALLAFAGAGLIGGNGFLAAFVAGLTVARAAPALRTSIRTFGASEGELLALLTFMVFGAALLPQALARANATTIAYALGSLTLVRMLPVAVALAGTGLRPATILFLGWFGPRGIASVLFGLLVLPQAEHLPPALVATVFLTVALSIVAHGMTAGPLSRQYARHLSGQARHRPGGREHGPALNVPPRSGHSRVPR